MLNAINIHKQPPEITLSVDSVVYRGLNQIRRNIAKHTSLYIGKHVQDRIVDLYGGQSISIKASEHYGDIFEDSCNADVFSDGSCSPDTSFKCLYLDTTGPVSVILDEGGVELKVKKHLVLDHQCRFITITNESCQGDCYVRLFISYIV